MPSDAMAAGPVNSNIGTKFVEIKAFDQMGATLQFIAGGYYTATGLLSLVQSIHSAIGNFNLIRFIKVECSGTSASENAPVDPNITGSQIRSEVYSGNGSTNLNLNFNWNGSLDSYVTAIQQAAGGQIIPDADMNPFFGANNCGGTPNPTAFYNNSASLLKLSAIADGQRYLMLESWDPAYGPSLGNQSSIDTFFQTLEAQGWKGFMPQSNDPDASGQGPKSCNAANYPFSDYGYAGYIRNGLFWINATYPYVFPHFNLICSIWQAEPYLNGVVLGIESQTQQGNYSQPYCDGAYVTAGSAFEGCLTFSQRETALTYLAQNQARYNYTFIYPVVIGDHSIEYDAQQDGTLDLMEQLINEYNVPPTTTSTLTTTTRTTTTTISSATSDSSSSSKTSTSSSSSTTQTSSLSTSTSTTSSSTSAQSPSSTTSYSSSSSTTIMTTSTLPASSSSTTTLTLTTSITSTSIQTSEATNPPGPNPWRNSTTSNSTSFSSTSTSTSFFSTDTFSASDSSSLSSQTGVSSVSPNSTSFITVPTSSFSPQVLSTTRTSNNANRSVNGDYDSSVEPVKIATTYGFSTFLTVLILGVPPLILYSRRSR